jgi:hypothetical protein
LEISNFKVAQNKYLNIKNYYKMLKETTSDGRSLAAPFLLFELFSDRKRTC